MHRDLIVLGISLQYESFSHVIEAYFMDKCLWFSDTFRHDCLSCKVTFKEKFAYLS